MLNALRRAAGEKRAAGALYAAIVARSREPVFFRDLSVADSFDGRFDLMVLHSWLVIDALRQTDLSELERRLVQVLFIAFDEGLRDQGAGDMGIGRRIKAMTSALYGRINVYDSAAAPDSLVAALKRNLYRGKDVPDDCLRQLLHYIAETRKSLATSDLAQGDADFGALPRSLEKQH